VLCSIRALSSDIAHCEYEDSALPAFQLHWQKFLLSLPLFRCKMACTFPIKESHPCCL